jgi:prealbumin domain-containing protein
MGVALIAIGALTFSFGLVAFAATFTIGPVGTAAGFEDNDGNMVRGDSTLGTPGFDWNSFALATGGINWTGTASYRQTGTVTYSGWQFLGIEDAINSHTDTSFAGGVKQDDNCASVIGSGVPNKDDLSGIMLASKTGSNGHTYLMLNWTRAPQNTTSSSAHVGFEFNQSKKACPGTGSDGLVERTPGDLLLVYDFTGGGTVPPTLSLSRWVATGACQVGSDSPPCWGTFIALPCGTAEANVDTGLSVTTPDSSCVNVTETLPGSTVDDLTPPAPPATLSTTSTLAKSTFGEAGVDLTKAGVFSNTTCESFGQVEGISRSSGDANTAAMEDLVGPGKFTLTNCGEVKIIKLTDPAGLNQPFGFTSNLAGTQLSCTVSSGTSFMLNDGAGQTNTQDCTNVPAGSFYVLEGTEPSGFTDKSLNCTASGTGTSVAADDGSTFPTSTSVKADITMAGGGLVTCTYVNQAQANLIVVKKTNPANDLTNQPFPFMASGSPTTNPNFTPTSFSLCTGTACGGPTNQQTYTSIVPGTYSVTETVPANWTLASAICTYTAGPDSGGNTGTPNLGTGTVSGIALNAGDTVTCTYTDNIVPGTIVIKKVTNPLDTTTQFPFTPTNFGAPFKLTGGSGSTSSMTFTGIMPSNETTNIYSVSEDQPLPAGWTLVGSTCDNGGTPSNITVLSGKTTTCTFTNEQGAIQILKESSKAAATPLTGAMFKITTDAAGLNQIAGSPFTTDGSGLICVGNLAFATYYVTETAAPAGYSIDDSTTHSAVVNTPGSCPGSPSVGDSFTFTDTPLTDLTVTVKSEATGGTTSMIKCVGPSPSTSDILGSPQGPGGSVTLTSNGLVPGTYTCTVVIDP